MIVIYLPHDNLETDMQAIDLIDDHRPEIRLGIERMPSTRLLGLKVLGLGDGVSLLEMAIRPEITFDGRNVQLGIVGTLADYAAVSAANTVMPAGWAAATTGIEVHNLEPANGVRLLAVGRSIRSGKGLSLGEARVYAQAEDGPVGDPTAHRLVAVAMATCRGFALEQRP